jgi:hypothetical protein
MGNVATKGTQRTAPARYVAKQLPRAPADVEEEFAKAKLTIQGINKMREKVNTTPQPYVETKSAEDGTPLTDMSAPRWYLNTWMELMDNTRQDRAIISGALPTAWNRDHNEPYSLVRNRIDDEDLDWLLSEGKKMPIEQLLSHTKLERESLEDILATVEAPKKQYRNYQGKIHRAIENTNTFMQDRQKRMEENRNEELLKQIGYSDEELEDEKQYMTNRSRGVKTLDDLGVSIRRKKRLDRFAQHNDMEILLEERRLQAIEAGTYEPTEEELQRPEAGSAGRVKGAYYKARFTTQKNVLRLDLSHSEKDQQTREKISDWLEARKHVEYGKDKFPEEHTPEYHEALSTTEEAAKVQLDANAARGQVMAHAGGMKRWADPRQQYDTMLKIMRESNQSRDGVTAEVEQQQRDISAAGKAFDADQKEKEHLENVANMMKKTKLDPDQRIGYIPKIERELIREQREKKQQAAAAAAQRVDSNIDMDDVAANTAGGASDLKSTMGRLMRKRPPSEKDQQQDNNKNNNNNNGSGGAV